MNLQQLTLMLLITALAAARSDGKSFNLPSKEPLFSIALPDNWDTDAQSDSITSRPKNSAMVISIFPAAAAKNLPDALAIVAKNAGTNYAEWKVGESSQEVEAGMKFIEAEAKGKQNGVEMRIFLYAFSPDGVRYFGICTAADKASGEKFGDDADQIMSSIRSLKDPGGKQEKEEVLTRVAYPKDKPAFTVEVPASVTIESTAGGITLRKKGVKSFLTIATIPPQDGVTDDTSAQAWLPKKTEELLKVVGPSDAKSSFGGELSHFLPLPQLSLRADYGSEGDAEEKFRIWVFTTGGQRYFYAFGRVNDLAELMAGSTTGIWWGDAVMKSIQTVK